MNYNLSLVKARLRRRKGIVIGDRTKIMWSAKIVNLGRSDDCIYTGSDCVIRGELLTFAHGGEIQLGNHCYIGDETRIWSGAKITVGNYVMVAHGVSIMDNLTHPLNHLKRREHFSNMLRVGHPTQVELDDKPIVISDDAWIGAHSIILRGISIGARAIVGAGSVVTGDVADDSIVAGNPATVIRTNT